MTWRIQGLSVTIERNDNLQDFFIVTSFFIVVMAVKKQKWKKSQFVGSHSAQHHVSKPHYTRPRPHKKNRILGGTPSGNLRQDSGSRSAFCGRFKQPVKRALTQNSVISGDYQKEFQIPDVRWYLKIPCTFLGRILFCWQQLCNYVCMWFPTCSVVFGFPHA